MSNERMPKQIVIVGMEGRRNKGRPWKNRPENAEEDMKIKRIRN